MVRESTDVELKMDELIKLLEVRGPGIIKDLGRLEDTVKSYADMCDVMDSLFRLKLAMSLELTKDQRRF